MECSPGISRPYALPKIRHGSTTTRTNNCFHWVAFAAELSIQLAVFALFASAYPDGYRSLLWLTGGVQGWNSNPEERIYFYANHKTPPEIPWIWTQRFGVQLDIFKKRQANSGRSTDANLATATVAVIVCLAKGLLIYLHQSRYFVVAFYDVSLAALWILCISNQSSGDYSSPAHPSPRPWYLVKSCKSVEGPGAKGCTMAQASFAISVLVLMHYPLLVQASKGNIEESASDQSFIFAEAQV
ncbi:unnamed protein product [Penicillium camemberti]|nr:unnamed protein product [Penicillium camemberti]